MKITTYLRLNEPFEMDAYRLCHLHGDKRPGHSSLYAISKHADSNGKRDWRVLALRNGFGIKRHIESYLCLNHKDPLHIHASADVVE